MKEKQINIRVTEDIKQRLELKAQKTGMKVSEYVRFLIIKDLEK